MTTITERQAMEAKQRLRACPKKLSLALVWRELQVFSKLIYRGRNQHRRDKCYQKLTRLSKELRLYENAALAAYVSKFLKSFHKRITASVTARGATIASKLIDCAKFVIKLLEFIKDTFREVDQKLCMSLFIPFNLVMATSLSRIWYCLHHHLLAISETYEIIKQAIIPSFEKFHPSLDAYLSRRQSCTYLNIHKEKGQMVPNHELGSVVQRTQQVLPLTRKPMEEEVCIKKGGMGLSTSIDLEKSEESLMSVEKFSEEDSINESYRLEQHHLQSFLVSDAEPMTKSPCNKEPLLQSLIIPDVIQPLPINGDNLNQPVAMKTVEVDKLRTRSLSKRIAKTKKKANTLMFHCCHGRHRPVKFWLRGRKVMAALTSNKIQVTAINVKFMRRLPTGSNNHIISSCFLSLLQRCPRANHHACGQRTNVAKCGVLEPDVREFDGSKWLEVERTRLSQISGSSATCVHEKFTDELDSAASVAMEIEHDTSHLLSMETNSGKGCDEIDDIFGALDGML